jgi:drug/metabolite transporter (DMT)-like permease
MPEAGRDDPLRAIGLLLGAMLFFSCSDAASKVLTSTLPAIEIAWLRYAVFALILLSVAFLRGTSLQGLRSTRPFFQAVRAAGMLGSSVLFITGLRYLPMAEATSISFISPLIVTALSIPLLGETVGIRRWTAVLVGLAGVLIVIRPGTSAFNTAALLPLLSAASWAIALIATRKASGDNAVTALTWAAVAGFGVLSAMVPFVWVPIGWRELMLGIVTGVCSTIAQWLIVLAFRYGRASVLAPFSYSQLIWSSALGFVVFGAFPDLWTWVGAAVIAGSGIYTAHRERVRAPGR